MNRLIFSAILMIFIMAGCGDSGTGPSADAGIHGWTVGDGAGTVPTILKTVDGLEWTAQGADLSIPGAGLSSISVVDSSVVWAAGGISEGFGVVVRTIDGGETWERAGNESEIPKSVLAIKAFSADVAWVCGDDNCIYRTTDGGVTWTDMASQEYQGYSWQGINGISQGSIWITGGTQQKGAIIHTTDGLLWTLHGDSLTENWPMISIAALDQNNIWAVGHGFTILKSTDGGIQWELVTPDSLQDSGNDANGITVLSSSDAWVALDYGNIWRTTDGGATWEYQSIPPEAAGFFMMRISAIDQNTAWVSGGSAYGAPEGILLHTTDGGATWSRQDEGTLPFMVDVGFAGEFN